MSDGDRLLAYCSAYPDDDLAHRAYADWLEEQGDDARAEFVRLQLDRAALWEGHPDCEDFWDRERALLAAHGATWRAELPAWARDSASFSRGLLTSFEITGWKLLDFDPAQRGFTILALRLRASEEEMADIAARGLLRGIRSLTVLGELSTNSAIALAKGTHLAGLRRLTFQTFAPPDTLAALFHSPGLAGLESLQLTSACDGLAGLLAAPETAFRLLRLSVRGNAVPCDLRALVQAASCADLEELRLPGPSVRGKGRKKPAISTLPRLTHLDLTGSRLNSNALVRCAVVLGRCRPERLNLSFSAIKGDGIARVLECFDLGRLVELSLGHTQLGGEGLEALCRVPIPSLRYLRLDLAGITDEGLVSLARSPLAAGLRQLILEGDKGLSADAFRVLLHSPAIHHLEMLSCSYMELGPDVAEVIATSPYLRSLRCLELGQNKIGPAGARSIASSTHLPSLLRLDSSGNQLGPEGGEALLASPLMDRLVRLDLASNGLGPDLRSRFNRRANSRPWQI